MIVENLKAQGVYEGNDYLPSVYNEWTVEEETVGTPRWLLFIHRAKLMKNFHLPVDKKILSTFCR